MEKKEYGFLRPIDKLGRFVIPCDLRKQYGIQPQDEILVIPQRDGILLKPYEKTVSKEP